MKTLFRLLCFSLVSIGTLQARAGTTLLTFDNLSPGSSYVAITNGYGGLQWLGFAALAPSHFPGSAYNLALESGTNVAFNFDEFDRRAYISSLNPFTANSAYLTAVQGTPPSNRDPGLYRHALGVR